jgi:hypothetical protein
MRGRSRRHPAGNRSRTGEGYGVRGVESAAGAGTGRRHRLRLPSAVYMK